MHVWVCQGLGQGLVPTWIKSRWRPWQGKKPPVSHILLFYSAFTSILPMAAWHVWQGRLGFILECTIVYKTKKEQNRLLSCACSFFSWGYQTGYGSQATLACIKVKRHLEWPQNEQTCDPMSKNMHLTNINYAQKSSKDVFRCIYLFGSIMDTLLQTEALKNIFKFLQRLSPFGAFKNKWINYESIIWLWNTWSCWFNVWLGQYLVLSSTFSSPSGLHCLISLSDRWYCSHEHSFHGGTLLRV